MGDCSFSSEFFSFVSKKKEISVQTNFLEESLRLYLSFMDSRSCKISMLSLLNLFSRLSNQRVDRDLDSNLLSGPIPVLETLKELRVLFVFSSFFLYLFSWFSHTHSNSHSTNRYLGSNNLSGSFPSWIGKLSSLRNLYVEERWNHLRKWSDFWPLPLITQIFGCK